MTHPTPTESPEDTIEVPARALVSCPLVAFELRQVLDCHACPKCAGLEDRFPGAGHLSFEKRYLVRCLGEPVKRPVVMLAEKAK